MADAAAFDRQMAAQSGPSQALIWVSLPDPRISLKGLGFFEKEGQLHRLPRKQREVLGKDYPELRELSSHTAGASLRFRTDSPQVWVRAEMNSAPYMAHMTPAGQCGFDCYLRSPLEDRWQFRGLTKFPVQQDYLECCLADHLEKEYEVLIHLPLYIGLSSLKIGLQPGASLKICRNFAHSGALAVYGTSIDQGGCASRPGMAYPAILSRELSRQIYNLGFSGNGLGQPEMADILCSLPDLRLLIVDIQANAGPQRLLEANLPAFLDRVRQLAPVLPILVLSATPQTDLTGYALRAGRSFRENEEFQQQEVNRRIQKGDRHIRFVSGRQLLEPVGTEATVDGVHLTDLGFSLLAQGLLPILKKML